MTVPGSRRLEEAMANMLPPKDSMLVDGWLLRFTPGTSRNPSSVWPLYGGAEGVDERITFCEKQYAARGLECSFRLTECAEQTAIEDALVRRGYRIHNPNRVLTNADFETTEDTVDLVDLDGWLDTLRAIDPDMGDEVIGVRRGPLSRITLPSWYGLVSCEGRPCTYGRAVQQGDLYQLAELWTSPELRGRGLGTRLIRGLLAIGRRSGAETAFLPVSVANDGARRLYERLGFRDVYGFRYLIPST